MGVWRIPIAELVAGTLVEKVKPGETRESALFNLLSVDAPTKMVEWEIGNLRLPVGLFAKATVAGAVTLTVDLYLRIGGELVWQETKEITLASGQTRTNVTFNADLINTISLASGKSMTLQLSVTPSVEVDEVRAGGGESQNVTAPVLRRVEGFLTYSARQLTGHRVLS